MGTGDRATSREGVKHIASASSVWVELSETARPTSKVRMLLVQVVLGTAATGTFAREGLGEVRVVDVRMAFGNDGDDVVQLNFVVVGNHRWIGYSDFGDRCSFGDRFWDRLGNRLGRCLRLVRRTLRDDTLAQGDGFGIGNLGDGLRFIVIVAESGVT